MKVLIDLNIVLDVILNRRPFVEEAKQIWDAHASGVIDGTITATELTNLFYIIRRIAGESIARTSVKECLSTFAIASVDRDTLENAAQQVGVDFEDNVCIACAEFSSIDLIVTRDPNGFTHSRIPVLSPTELLVKLAQTHDQDGEQ